MALAKTAQAIWEDHNTSSARSDPSGCATVAVPIKVPA